MPKKYTQRPANRKKIPQLGLVKQENTQKSQELSPNQTYQVKRKRALQFVDASRFPFQFRHRQKQTQQITQFIKKCFQKQKKFAYRILMITGAPGLGKSLTVNTILRQIEKEKNQFEVLTFNANIIKSIRDVQELICQKILDIRYGNNMSTIQILRLLEKKKTVKKWVIYIEEIEIILQQKINIFSEQFFSLFSSPKSNLMLLGISNTIDAMGNYSKNAVINLDQIKNVVFQPYRGEQIGDIVKDKLQNIQKSTGFKFIYNDKILKYIGGKLANAKKGDMRNVLEFMKNLLREIIPEDCEKSPSISEQGYELNIRRVAPLMNRMEMKFDPQDLIKSLPYTQQIIIIAIYLLSKEEDQLFMTIKTIKKKLQWVCKSLCIEQDNHIFNEVMEILQQYSIIKKLSKKNNEERYSLSISLQSIETALKEFELFKKFFEP